MKWRIAGVLTVALGLAAVAAPVRAHHSISAYYDLTRTVTFQGTVTKVEWMSPHIYYYVDVRNAGGQVVNYAVEGAAPTVLHRQGWNKESLKVGDMVTVSGYPSKDGWNHINGRAVTLPDGTKLFSSTTDK